MGKFDLGLYGESRVTVVILARNEVRSIGDAITGAQGYAHDVIVMDGHSNDGTAELARELGAIVHLDPGRGKGSAIRRSLELTDAGVVVMMDADGSHDPADIPRLALPVVHGDTDLCIGSRFSGGSDELSVSVGQLVRSIGNISMNIAINTRWKTALTDTLNGFRAVRREAALAAQLRENRHTIEQEMVMKMLRHGYRVSNTPTHEYVRRYGESHISIWREWPRFVWCVIANVSRHDLPAKAVPSGAASVGVRRDMESQPQSVV